MIQIPDQDTQIKSLALVQNQLTPFGISMLKRTQLLGQNSSLKSTDNLIHESGRNNSVPPFEGSISNGVPGNLKPFLTTQPLTVGPIMAAHCPLVTVSMTQPRASRRARRAVAKADGNVMG